MTRAQEVRQLRADVEYGVTRGGLDNAASMALDTLCALATVPHTERNRIRALSLLVQDVANSGVELDDARLDYVTVQLDRHTWGLCRLERDVQQGANAALESAARPSVGTGEAR